MIYYDDDGQAGNMVIMTMSIGPLKAYYYLKDHLGSVRMTVDAGGNVAGYDDYDAFGGIMSVAIPNWNRDETRHTNHFGGPDRSSNSGLADAKYKFTGKERDVETSLDYFGARYYDSRIGRWLSVDPMAEKYPGWSPYNYGLNNPLRNVDPNGMGLSDFYDLQGKHKHIDDKDQNAYLVTEENLRKVNASNGEQIKTDNSTVSLGNNADLVALANVVFNEARGESNATQIAIAFTALNRSDISGKTVTQEVYKPKQFSGIERWAALTLENVSKDQRLDLTRSYSSAIISLKLHCFNINPVGNNVTHFYSPSSPTDRPSWGDATKELLLPTPYNEGNFIYWHDLSPYAGDKK